MKVGTYEARVVEKGVEETTLSIKEGDIYWIVQMDNESQMDVERQVDAEILSRLIRFEQGNIQTKDFIKILKHIKKVNNNKCKLVEVAIDTHIRLLKGI